MRKARYAQPLTTVLVAAVIACTVGSTGPTSLQQAQLLGQETRPVPLSAELAQQWRAQIRSTLHVPDPLPSLEIDVRSEFEPLPAIVAERLTYQTQFGLRVPAIVYRPADQTVRRPALVVVNGHGGDKYSWYAFYSGMLYARAGAVVLTYDPIGEGERNIRRASGTRAHDMLQTPEEMGPRLSGLMLTDLMQGVSLLRRRPDVDPERIAVMGYSMGSFVVALAGAIDQRIQACVLAGGGNLDGPGGYWDRSKPMCQGLPYQALAFLEDRPAALYALHAARGPTLLINGTNDTVVAIPTHGLPFFADLFRRTARLHGGTDGVFDFQLIPGVSHRPLFVTRPVALWLEQHLDLPNWDLTEIERLPTIPVGRWAEVWNVSLDRLYATEEREGGTPALDSGIPGLSRDQLSVFTLPEWEEHQASLIYESWVEKARAAVQSRGMPDDPRQNQCW